MKNVVIMVAIYLAIAMAGMLLQSWLSKREKKWPGLIIPLLFFLVSFLYPFNMAVPPEGLNADFVIRLFLSWIMGNIPTFIMLGIYLITRQEMKKEKKRNRI